MKNSKEKQNYLPEKIEDNNENINFFIVLIMILISINLFLYIMLNALRN